MKQKVIISIDKDLLATVKKYCLVRSMNVSHAISLFAEEYLSENIGDVITRLGSEKEKLEHGRGH